MKIISVFIICFLIQLPCLYAQYTVQVVVHVPGGTERAYISGSFNDWDPGNENYKLQPAGAEMQHVTLHNIPNGKIEFKFTRGEWEYVESDGKAGSMPNRECIIASDTILHASIAGWSDDYVDLSQLPDSARFLAMISRGFYFL